MAVARGAALSSLRRVVAASGVWAAPAATWRPASRVLSSATPETAPEVDEGALMKTTIGDVLATKSSRDDGSWLWCTTDDTVFDAVKSMTSHNVGALLVLRPETGDAIAGIITERDYLRKIIVQGRSSKTTKVGEIMTEENKLITVKPGTKVLSAMQLMTENRIRHIPVVEGQKMKGMVSIGDVVRAVLAEHQEEVTRLNEYIKGSY